MRINLFKAKVRVDMFDDCMEIYSPGGMVDGTFIQNYGLEKAVFTGVTTADVLRRDIDSSREKIYHGMDKNG